MRPRHGFHVGILAFALGCGGSSSDGTTSDEAPVSNADSEPGGGEDSHEAGPGTYVWESESGAIVRYTVPAPSDDPLVVGVESFRNDIGIQADVSYVIAELDNTSGSEQVEIPDLAVVTEDGDTVTYKEAWLLVGDWQNEVSTDDDDLYNRGVNLYNDMLDDGSALPGAKASSVFAAESALLSIRRVFASNGFEEPVELSKD